MEMATKIQIDVIGKIEGTQFMKCKLYTNENIVIINTTNTFIEKN